MRPLHERGNCYERAFKFAIQADWTLCHGVPTLTGGPHEGQRYGHAWAESNGGMVYDADADVVVTREMYYRAGTIDPEEVVRYNRREACEAALDSGHFGPWVEYGPDVLLEDPDETGPQ